MDGIPLISVNIYNSGRLPNQIAKVVAKKKLLRLLNLRVVIWIRVDHLHPCQLLFPSLIKKEA